MSLMQYVQPATAERRSNIAAGPSRRIVFPKAILLWIRARLASLPEGDGLLSSGSGRVLPFVTGRCLRHERLLKNDFTPAEWEHVAVCSHCRNTIVRLQESAEPRLRKWHRRVRLTLHDWNPVLQFFTMLVILAAMGWSVHQVRIVTRVANRAPTVPHLQSPVPPAVTAAHATDPPPAVQASPMDSRDELAQQIGAKLPWPWTSCTVSPDVINRWLGQGRMRTQIGKDLEVIERSLPRKSSVRKQAAKIWCDSLGQGSRTLAQEARQHAETVQRRRIR